MIRAWLVEDDPADRRLLHEGLPGIAVERDLDTLQAALAALEATQAPPDVLLADLHLPDSAGLATLDHLLDAAHGVPVVVVTGDDVAAEKAVQVGAQDAVTKDHLADLGRVVRNAVARATRPPRSPDGLATRFLDLELDLLVVLDEDLLPIQVNGAFTRVLGWRLADLAAYGWRSMVHPEDITDAGRALAQIGADHPVVTLEQRFLASDGTYRWLHWRVARDETTRLLYAVARDITEVMQEREDLRRQVSTDPLTGLPNRRALMEHLRAWVGRDRELSVLFCDLDGFKEVNDRFGHDAGDRVLVAVAERLAPLLRRRADILARYAGDEFVMVADRVGTSGAEELARRCMDAVGQPVDIGGVEVTVGMSVGIAEHSPLLRDAGSLMTAADKALYVAKRAGGGQARRWGPDLHG